VKDRGIYEDVSPLVKRSRAVFLGVAAAFIVLAAGYWKIQILDYRKYWAMSEANRTREVIIPAPRAVLTDRSGQIVLAGNEASFRASIIRENTKDLEASFISIGELLDLDPGVIRERVEKYAAEPSYKPVVIKDGLLLEEVAKIEARKLDIPELEIEAEPRRAYPFGSLAAHVLGYMQELTAEELQGAFKGRRLGDLVGRSGIESAYESRIAGADGKVVEVVDSLGRKRGEIDKIEPRQPQKVLLTLDYELQAKAESLLSGREGAVAVLDPKTGGILALASSPTFDPAKFVNRFTAEEWTALANDPDNPMLNRATQGLYSPGSMFKLVMAAAGLDTGTIVPQTTVYCSGSTEIYGRRFHCWFEAGHGTVDLYEAIRQSCNIYFYAIGRRMNIDVIARYAADLGLGRKTGIDLPGEKEGLVPTTEWKKRVLKQDWYPGETISIAIGQGQLQVTPVQVAAMTAMIANRGKRVRPHLVEEGGDFEAGRTNVPPAVLEEIIEGMWRSANKEGTGRAARVDGFDVCSKTGTVQTISRETAERLKIMPKTHSWFTGFAPRNDPQVVVTAIVEFGGTGGAVAAPAAGELFRLFKAKYDDR
jgi:penicillin-binding protein 2